MLDEVKEWRSRALDAVYPIVIFDALRVKIRDKDSRIVKNKAVYLALGVAGDGQREVLGLWIAENEGAKFWLSVMTELRNRGVQDILIAVVDWLKGFPEAINSAFPETTVNPGLCPFRAETGHRPVSGTPFTLHRASRPPLSELHSSGKQRTTLFPDPPHLEGPQGGREICAEVGDA